MEKKKNFSEEERAVLLELLSRHGSVVENKRTDAASVSRKQEAWKKIEDEFNCRQNVTPRKWTQLKKCWENLKDKWKRTNAEDMRERFATGGGTPPPSQMTDELQRVGDIASHMSVRLPNPSDSDRCRHNAVPGGSQPSKSQCTPAVAALLSETQDRPLEQSAVSPNTCKRSYGGGLPASRVSIEALDRGHTDALLAPAVLGGGPSSLITPGFSSTVCPCVRFPATYEAVVNAVDCVSITSLEASGSVSADAVSTSLAATSHSVGWCPSDGATSISAALKQLQMNVAHIKNHLPPAERKTTKFAAFLITDGEDPGAKYRRPESSNGPPGNAHRHLNYKRRCFSTGDAHPDTGRSNGTRIKQLLDAAARSPYGKNKQLPPLPTEGYKVVVKSQGGLDLTTLVPRNLLSAFMQAAALTETSTLQLRIHPVNNTCTVSVANQDDALKLVQLQKITYDERQYAMTAYIAPPDGSVRGVITNAYWKESPQELLCNLVAGNPNETILDARRMGMTRSILITSGQTTFPRKIVYGGGLYLCTPYTLKVETCSNCRSIGHRTDVCVQPRTHKCPRCGLSHPMDETTTCTPVCIICQCPHLSASRECKYRHLARTKQSSERQAMYRRHVENKSPHPANTKRTEARGDPQLTGLPQSSNRTTWADKLKTPQMTTALQSHAPPTPDPLDQELRALRAEVSCLMTLLTPPSVPPPPLPNIPPQILSPHQSRSHPTPLLHLLHPPP
ncbi:hypothetical protein HPB50_012194 [Hyalomma asiaticum]|uniref:Uncharacterized protein n=1 Tax=Hyalomma asiaticum TaxID=266040 RepID=A0ACB7S3B3_HYAAI|nr:hypothetical protein HPB50_012194 [Hyalomma asiaticum]